MEILHHIIYKYNIISLSDLDKLRANADQARSGAQKKKKKKKKDIRSTSFQNNK